MKSLRLGLLFAAVFSMAACNFASGDAAKDLKTISTVQLADGIKSKGLYVFDNNRVSVFEEHHIPTAVNMNPRDPDASVLPADKNAKLVFYCMNTMCRASHKGANFAVEQGYPNTYVYGDGIEGWIEAGQPVVTTK